MDGEKNEDMVGKALGNKYKILANIEIGRHWEINQAPNKSFQLSYVLNTNVSYARMIYNKT